MNRAGAPLADPVDRGCDSFRAPSGAWRRGRHRRRGDDPLESALARPKNRLAHEPDSDLAALAAAYLFGLVKNHAYVDGNKRVGFASAATFLRLNGLRLTAPEADTYDAVIEVVEGSRAEPDLADWIRENTEPVR